MMNDDDDDEKYQSYLIHRGLVNTRIGRIRHYDIFADVYCST